MWLPTSWLRLLAIASSDGSPIGSILSWSALLLVILVLASLGYAQLKRWMASSGDVQADGFTFSGLRELHRQGRLSDGEYEVARNQLVLATRKSAGSLGDPLARSGAGVADAHGVLRQGSEPR